MSKADDIMIEQEKADSLYFMNEAEWKELYERR